jgi:hypothetical protein
METPMFLALYLACLTAVEEESPSPDGAGSGSSSSIYEEFCQRADDCNFLTGMSESECAREYETAVESCSGSEEDDWATDVADCNSEHRGSCSNWESCLMESYTWGCWGY